AWSSPFVSRVTATASRGSHPGAQGMQTVPAIKIVCQYLLRTFPHLAHKTLYYRQRYGQPDIRSRYHRVDANHTPMHVNERAPRRPRAEMQINVNPLALALWPLWRCADADDNAGRGRPGHAPRMPQCQDPVPRLEGARLGQCRRREPRRGYGQ